MFEMCQIYIDEINGASGRVPIMTLPHLSVLAQAGGGWRGNWKEGEEEIG